MKVKAIAEGYINNQIKRVGDRFECSTQAFSPSWMAAIDERGRPLKEQPKKMKAVIKEAYPILDEHNIKAEGDILQGDESEEELVEAGLSIVEENNGGELNDLI